MRTDARFEMDERKRGGGSVVLLPVVLSGQTAGRDVDARTTGQSGSRRLARDERAGGRSRLGVIEW